MIGKKADGYHGVSWPKCTTQYALRRPDGSLTPHTENKEFAKAVLEGHVGHTLVARVVTEWADVVED